MTARYGPPFAPGTFWDIHGRRYVIDPACHWVRIDEAVLFRVPPMAPDPEGAVQLHLVPIDPAAEAEGCSCSCTCEGKTHHWASCEHRPAAEPETFEDELDAHIAESMRDPGYRAASLTAAVAELLTEFTLSNGCPADDPDAAEFCDCWRSYAEAALAAHSTEGAETDG